MISPAIKLLRPDWYHREGISCRGWCWDDKAVFRSGKDFLGLFTPTMSPRDFEDIIGSLNGCFCVVLRQAGTILAAVDRIRSMPLFYSHATDVPVLSDDAREAANCLPSIRIDPIPLAEFLLTGYVCGSDTLPSGLKQVQAGQILIWEAGAFAPRVQSYFEYRHQTTETRGEAALDEELDELHMAIARRLVQSAAGRQILLPLSGGLDSRLIARCLARLKTADLLCFSYGDPRGREAKISQAVAEHLKLPWYFVPHTRDMWHQAYNSQSRKEYYHFADNLSASAHIQDWLAVRELKDRKIVSFDAVFVPGHSADFLEGSHLPLLFMSKEQFTSQDVAEAIIARHYRLWDFKQVESTLQEALRSRIRDGINSPIMDPEAAASAFETFDWQERQAKFIINSVRVYEFFGFSWRLPLWDNELMDFWSRMPLEHRCGRSYYLRYAKNHGDLKIPVYTHESFPTRVHQHFIRNRQGYSYDIRYARFLKHAGKPDPTTDIVAGLCPGNLPLPTFVDQKLPIPKANINALQTLVMLKEWLEG